MKKVYQTIVDPVRGNCTVAAFASLLELELENIPHFNLYDEHWGEVQYAFMYFLGYKLEAVINPTTISDIPKDKSINGHFFASVKSKTFKDASHAVIMDTNGIVTHDPNPNELWLGVDLIKEIDKNLNYFKVWVPHNEEIDSVVNTFETWHLIYMTPKGFNDVLYIVE